MAFQLPSEPDRTPEPVLVLRGTVLTAAEEQKKWAQEALRAVETKAADMQAAIDRNESLRHVVRAAARVLDELRTNLLEPQNYYELYMKVFDVMETFTIYLEDAYLRRQLPLEEMYEQVQFCGFIVPRLYLLIAAGSVYVKVGEQPPLEIMQDLVEMCKGVQHPTRGLFLRHFLLTMMKGKLPGDPNRPASDAKTGDTVLATANLLVQNFKEMNWLWIRMEAGSYVNRNGGSTNSVATNTTAGAAASALPTSPPGQSTASGTSPGTPSNNGAQRTLQAAQRTQQERRAMCVLVGMNLVRISQLDGIDRDVYVSTLLPQLLSIMVRYCEPLAQQYLFEVLIQVFPDEFHLFTIDKLFDAITRTVRGVDVPNLLRSLMERLCTYAMAVQDGVTDVSSPEEEAKLRDVFPMLLGQLSNMPVTFRAQLHGSNVIKRTSAVPPPTPLLLQAYMQTARPLVTVALTLYSKSVKRRTMALANVVDVVAAKFTAAAAAAAEEEQKQSSAAESASSTPPPSAAGLRRTASTASADAPAKALVASDTEKGKDDATRNSKKAHAKKSKSGRASSGPGTAAVITLLGTGDVGISPAAALAACQFLVYLVTECCANVAEVLSMEGVEALAALLPFLERRDVAMAVCDVALRGSTAAPLLPVVSKAAAGATGGASSPKVSVVSAPPTRARLLTALEDVARLFELLDPILLDQPDSPADIRRTYKYSPDVEFVDEQNSVCRVMHLLSNDDPAIYLKMLTGVRKVLLQGGARRIRLTYPTLIALHRRAALRLHAHYEKAVRAAAAAAGGSSKEKKKSKNKSADATTVAAGAEGEEGSPNTTSADLNSNDAESSTVDEAVTAAYTKNVRKCFSHLYSGDSKSILEVYAVEAPLLALQEYVACAGTADACAQAETSYGLFAEALTLYDAHVQEAHDQAEILVAFVNALVQMRNMSEENYEVLAAKVCQYASKMLKKHDQSRLIAVCASLFAKKQLSEDNRQRVQECLKRSLKLADQVLALTQLHLYVELLNVFLHFYTAKTSYLVSVELINELVERINEASETQREAIGPANTTVAPVNADGADGEEKASAVPPPNASNDEAAATFAGIRLMYRNITKYIRSRQSAEQRWSAVEV